MVTGGTTQLHDVPILGIYQTANEGIYTVYMYNVVVCLYNRPFSGGRIAVYGDSNCLDSAHMQRGIYTIQSCLHTMCSSSLSLVQIVSGCWKLCCNMSLLHLPLPLSPSHKTFARLLPHCLNVWKVSIYVYTYRHGAILMYDVLYLPLSLCFTPTTGNRLHLYSRVLDPQDSSRTRPLPACPHLIWAKPRPINSSSPR